MKDWRPILLSLVTTLVVAIWVGRWLLGFDVEQPTVETSDTTPAYVDYNVLLEQYAHLEGVDYTTMRQDLLSEQVYGFFAKYGPLSQPHLYPDDQAVLAYHINAYNALMRIVIARRWPVDSPLELRGAIEPTKGFGLFQAKRFRVDGETLSLSKLDKRILANPAYDPRVRLVMACGGQSCPRVVYPAFQGERLDAQLDARIQLLLSDPLFLRVDRSSKSILVMPMIMLYQDVISDWIQRENIADSFEAWLIQMAPPSLELAALLSDGYILESAPISWAVDVLP